MLKTWAEVAAEHGLVAIGLGFHAMNLHWNFSSACTRLFHC